MSLMYFRLYLTQTLLGYLFDLDSSNVNRQINGRMLGVLSEVLPVPAQDEPLSDLLLAAQEAEIAAAAAAAAAAAVVVAKGSARGRRRRRRRSAPSKSSSRSTRSLRKSSSMAPSRRFQSPRIKIVAKNSTAVNAKGTPRRYRWLARGTRSSFCTFVGTWRGR